MDWYIMSWDKLNLGKTKALEILGLSVCFLVFTFLYFDFTVDDAFILYRYGKNLWSHGVWNYNPIPAPRQEAYTSLIGALLSLFPAMLKISPKWFITGINLASIIGLTQHLHYNKLENKQLINWLIVSNALIFIHFFSGMETFLFMLSIFLLGYLSVENKNPRLLLVLCLLIPFIRPDGILFSLWGLAYYSGVNKKRFSAALGILILFGFYWLFRWNYFDNFLPNPIEIKSFQEFKITIFLSNLYQAKVYLLILFMFWFWVENSKIKTLCIAAFLTLVIFYCPSRLMMNYADRFFFQVAFPVFLVALIYFPIRKKVFLPAIVLFNIYSLSPFHYNPIVPYGQRLEDSYMSLGKALQPFSSAQTWMVTGEAGSIPYFSEWNNLDPLGLGTMRINSKNPYEEVQLISPVIIFFYENGNKELQLIPGKVLPKKFNDWMNEEKYYPAAHSWFSPNYKLVIYLKKGMENEKEIRSALESQERYSFESITAYQRLIYKYFSY